MCRASSSSIRLLKSGDRCWTTTNAIVGSAVDVVEEVLERLEPSGGGADPDDDELALAGNTYTAIRFCQSYPPPASVNSDVTGASAGPS